MIEYTDRKYVDVGTTLVCDDASGTYGGMTEGRLYEAINGWEEGIFFSRPFVTVRDNNGKRFTAHLSRYSFPPKFMENQ